jgi:hypothetical protein
MIGRTLRHASEVEEVSPIEKEAPGGIPHRFVRSVAMKQLPASFNSETVKSNPKRQSRISQMTESAFRFRHLFFQTGLRFS